MPAPHNNTPEPTESASVITLTKNLSIPARLLNFSFVASPGPGGQNVNKRATKAQLRVALTDLPLDPSAQARLVSMASYLMTDTGELLIVCDDNRSQARNKAACIERLQELVRAALIPPKPRKATKPSRAAKFRRLNDKRATSQRKQNRRKGGGDDE